MTRAGIFGWDLPPGVSQRDINNAYGSDVCEVCAAPVDLCCCLECTICQSVGDQTCYSRHGMMMTDAQRASILKYEGGD